jgi:hypothetical protein
MNERSFIGGSQYPTHLVWVPWLLSRILAVRCGRLRHQATVHASSCNFIMSDIKMRIAHRPRHTEGVLPVVLLEYCRHDFKARAMT